MSPDPAQCRIRARRSRLESAWLQDDDLDAFSQLQLEHERTLFMFYGFRWIDGRPGGAYFKLAHSLSQALDDLHSNAGVADEGGYLVRDAFLEAAENDEPPVVHVELISVAEILARAAEEGDA